MNFRYTIYNRVTGLHTENECEGCKRKDVCHNITGNDGSGRLAKYQSHV